MRKLDLKAALCSGGTLSEYFEDESGPVDHLPLRRGLQVALLDRRDRRIDDDELSLGLPGRGCDHLDLARSEKRRRLGCPNLERQPLGDIQPDRFGKPCSLVEPGRYIPAGVGAKLRERNDGPGAACDVLIVSVDNAQAPDSSS
jgi:hypothetical protein